MRDEATRQERGAKKATLGRASRITAAAAVAGALGVGLAGPAAAATAPAVHLQETYALAPAANLPAVTNTPAATTAPNGAVGSAAVAGYDEVGADGGVFVFPVGGGSFFGSLPGLHVTVNNIAGMVGSADEKGYFLVGSDGGVFAFGDATFAGSLPGIHVVPSHPIVGIVPSSDDKGYFLVGSDGGVFTFGDSTFEGSLPGAGVTNDTAVGIASTPDNKGYWVLGASGDIYNFGDAPNLGKIVTVDPCTNVPNCTALPPPPLVSIVATSNGTGLWVTDADGNVINLGTAPALGGLGTDATTDPVHDVVSLVPAAGDGGYWLIQRNGQVNPFGPGAGNHGSLPDLGISVDDIVGAVPTGGA